MINTVFFRLYVKWREYFKIKFLLELRVSNWIKSINIKNDRTLFLVIKIKLYWLFYVGELNNGTVGVCSFYRLISTRAMTVKIIATWFFLTIFSLNSKNPPILINTILAAL